MDGSDHLPPAKTAWFPGLHERNHRITSEEDGFYNCVSWALGDEFTDYRIDPTDDHSQWPSDLPRNTDEATFVRFFIEVHGYEKSESQEYEEGFLKVAIYSTASGEFTHVARQKKGGKWTSKLGDWEDIEHDAPSDLNGMLYGKAGVFLRKKHPF